MDERTRERIKDAMTELKLKPCPRCGNQHFAFLDNYFRRAVQKDVRNTVIGGPSVVTVIAVCSRCGYLAEHALGILCPELLKEESETSKVPVGEEGDK